MDVLARNLDDGQAEDDGDEGKKRDAEPEVPAETSLMQLMFLTNGHHQPPMP